MRCLGPSRCFQSAHLTTAATWPFPTPSSLTTFISLLLISDDLNGGPATSPTRCISCTCPHFLAQALTSSALSCSDNSMSCTAVNEDGNPCICSQYKKCSKKTKCKSCGHTEKRHTDNHSAAPHIHGESISDIVNKTTMQLVGSASNFPLGIPQLQVGALPNVASGSAGTSYGVQLAGYGMHGHGAKLLVSSSGFVYSL